jgi:hypothetical protein
MLFLPATYATPSANPFTPGGEIVAPAPTSPSKNCSVWNRQTRSPVRASNAYTPSSGLELPTMTSGRPLTSRANAGGAQIPESGCAPGGSPKVPYDQRVEQSVAPLGSTALTAHRWPPSSKPSGPTSPKYTVAPLPSGSTTTGGVSTMPVVVNVQRVVPVAASSA